MAAALASDSFRFIGGMAAEKVAEHLLQLNDKLKAMTDIEGKMKMLKEMSTIIDKVIQDLDSRPIIDDAVKDLLKKLEDLARDLEDVVDYYDTKVSQKRQRSNTSFEMVRDFFSSDNPILFKSRVGFMIKAITERLESILLQKSILLDLPQGSIRMSESNLREQAHSRTSFVVIGREPEKNQIVDMLTKDDDDESGPATLKVITIVGMGGLGKTTLAQLVYNDEKVKAHFENLKMWTIVGAEFDPVKIMKYVLELATDAPVYFSQIDSVRKNLEKALSEKKFLLVLDGVWNEDQEKWGVLKTVLTCGARGSKILVTTRSQKVSSIMGSFHTHVLQQLSKDDCLSLFGQVAFGDEAAYQKLMEIGEKIAEKCGGVPLAAISLGNMLCDTRDETYWSSVSNSEIWHLRDEQKVLAVLKWSYDTLSLQSKKCFAFGSLFPKGYMMQKDQLIKLWIANGYVSSEGNIDAETVGNRVFDNLVLRSCFLLAPFENDPHVTHCSMHDLMHDLARSVSGNVYGNSIEDLEQHMGNRTYHLHLDSTYVSKITRGFGKKMLYLRTLILISCDLYLNANLLEIVFSELKFLRVLDLSDNGIKEVPTSIGNLIHLRYLNLSRNHMEVLPDSITLLPNLQYLDVSFIEKLRELPKDLGNMQSLRDLSCRRRDFAGSVFQRDFRLTHMPCGLSRLTNLRSLSVFVAGNTTGACSILELENLKLHGEMKIKFSQGFKTHSCGGKKILKNKDLNELYIEFNNPVKFDYGSPQFPTYSCGNDKGMLDDLSPNTNLKKLTIFDYGSPQFPTWLMELQLPNLVEVCLINCRVCEHIPPFGNLQFLKKLDLKFIGGITQIGADFHGHGGFPSLQELCLSEMYNLEEWSESQGVNQLFPSLRRLQVNKCPKLKSMPRLPRIQHLELSNCSEGILSCIGRLTSLSDLTVECLNNMTSLPSGCIRNLTSLTKLKVIECRRLQSLPGDEMQHLEMLRSLTIKWCDILASFPLEMGRLSSLYFLQLTDCPSVITQAEGLAQILNSAHKFHIHVCGYRVNLREQLQYLHTVKVLSLGNTHGGFNLKLKRAYGIPLSGVAYLSICCQEELESLMIAEPTSSVLEELYIYRNSNLTTLPHWLHHLKSLRLLSIAGCPRLERVPRDLKNLHMLETLRISYCPQLKKNCERETGEDWPIISHLPRVDIS